MYILFLSLQEYESADHCIDRLLQMEPNNYQAKQLKELIVKKLTRGKRIHHCSFYRSWEVRHLTIGLLICIWSLHKPSLKTSLCCSAPLELLGIMRELCMNVSVFIIRPSHLVKALDSAYISTKRMWMGRMCLLWHWNAMWNKCHGQCSILFWPVLYWGRSNHCVCLFDSVFKF